MQDRLWNLFLSSVFILSSWARLTRTAAVSIPVLTIPANTPALTAFVFQQVVNFVQAPAAVPGSTVVSSAPLLVAAPAAVAVPQVASSMVSAPNGFYASPTNPTVGYTCNNGYCYWTGTGDESSNSGRVFAIEDDASSRPVPQTVRRPPTAD